MKETPSMCTCGKPDPIRRRLLTGIAAVTAFGRLRPASAMTAGSGTLHQSSGDVLINGKSAQSGSAVVSGDTVATGPDGQAVFTLGDDAFLLRPEGAATVADGRDGREINLDSGRILSVFGPKRITLKTPLASVGIRGTAVYLESRPAVTNICVCYGRAVMVPVGDPAKAEEVQTHHHDAPRRIFPPGRDPVMEPYTVIDHTDEELVMLEALLGRVPPFMRR
ncbi:FecR domain-containing protein [Magnetospirillum sp. 15-1]|uniref:FecR domain-containing protein n=1 Tax=Magnetospirillum sp. 15-1 TaxID=1979370 RepID=UPI001F5B40E9|nr:FecR domain-containing protein [Magnetospirillum sp. 15-1]